MSVPSGNLEHDLTNFEQQLRSSGYQPLAPFFILKEGELLDERTGQVVHLTKDRLEKIAETQNSRTATTGDATPIIIGHTKRHLPENQQPPITGLAPRWEVVKFFKTDKWGLQTTPWAKSEDAENFRKFPRRSAEFWTNPDLIDPISLLGANTPRLDLGIHQLHRLHQPIYLQQNYRERAPILLEMDDMPAPDVNSDAPATPANSDASSGVFNSAEWKQMQAQVAQFAQIAELLQPFLEELKTGGMMGGDPSGMGGPPGAGAMGGAPPGGPPGGAPMGAGGPPPAPAGGPPGHPGGDDEPVQASALSGGYNGAVAGGMNTMIPQQMQMGRGQGQQVPDPRDPRDQVIATLQTQVAQLQLARMEDHVNSVLDDLETKLVFDRTREFTRLVRLGRAEFDAEVAYMSSTYRPKEEPLPTEAVPLHLQAMPPAHASAAMQGPMTLAQAHDAIGMPADPRLAKPGKPTNRYDLLQDIVRNRGRNGNVMDAYNAVMGQMANGTPGADGNTPIR